MPSLIAIPMSVFNTNVDLVSSHDVIFPPFSASSWNTLWAMLQADQALLQWVKSSDLPLWEIDSVWHRQSPFMRSLLLFHYRNAILYALNIDQKYIGILRVTVDCGEDLLQLTALKVSDVYLSIQLGVCKCASPSACSHRQYTQLQSLASLAPTWNECFEFCFPAKMASDLLLSFEMFRRDRLRSDRLIATKSTSIEFVPAGAIKHQWIRFAKRGRVRVNFSYDFILVPSVSGMEVTLHGAKF